MKNIVQKLVQENGNCVNLGRSLNASDPKLYNSMVDKTSFLSSDVKFTERLYCILNDINSVKIDAFGNKARFINMFLGYSDKEKSKNKSDNKKIPITRKSREETALEIEQSCLDHANLVNSTDKEIGKKIRKHMMQWANNSGKPLYSEDLIENIDYIVCPITKLRKTSIRSNYTESILGLTMNQYLDIVGKDFVLVCPGHKEKLKNSLKVIDEATGLTKHALSVSKSVKTLSIVDPNTGKSGYKKLGEKTRETHSVNIDENGLNGYQRLGISNIIKGNKTKQQRGLITLDEDRNDFKHYKNLIHWLTKRNSHHLNTMLTGRAGTEDAMQIDHMFSIFNGFKNGVSPFLLGSKFNLQLLPWKDNLEKSTNCSLTLEDLYDKSGYTRDKSEDEFYIIMDIIDKELDNMVSAGVLFEKFNERTKIL